MNNLKPPMLAVIREADCIGCTRCIQACPADAILGSAKWMHTVIAEECIGCQLCVPPCPVDCIDMVPVQAPELIENKSIRKQRAAHFRKRYHARQTRLLHEESLKPLSAEENEKAYKKAYVQAALERAQLKKKDKNIRK